MLKLNFKKRYLFNHGVIDPIIIIGVLFLVITLSIGVFVASDKNSSLNLGSRAKAIIEGVDIRDPELQKAIKVVRQRKVEQLDPAPQQTNIEQPANATSVTNQDIYEDQLVLKDICLREGGTWTNNDCSYQQQQQAIVEIGNKIVQKQQEEDQEEQQEENNSGSNDNTIAAIQKGCDANGAIYPEDSIVVGGTGSGSSGYAKCVGNQWQNCADCTIVDLSPYAVPTYLQDQYNQAIENITKVEQLDPAPQQTNIEQPANATSVTNQDIYEDQLVLKDICLREGGTWTNNDCSYQQQQQAIVEIGNKIVQKQKEEAQKIYTNSERDYVENNQIQGNIGQGSNNYNPCPAGAVYRNGTCEISEEQKQNIENTLDYYSQENKNNAEDWYKKLMATISTRLNNQNLQDLGTYGLGNTSMVATPPLSILTSKNKEDLNKYNQGILISGAEGLITAGAALTFLAPYEALQTVTSIPGAIKALTTADIADNVITATFCAQGSQDACAALQSQVFIPAPTGVGSMLSDSFSDFANAWKTPSVIQNITNITGDFSGLSSLDGDIGGWPTSITQPANQINETVAAIIPNPTNNVNLLLETGSGQNDMLFAPDYDNSWLNAVRYEQDLLPTNPNTPFDPTIRVTHQGNTRVAFSTEDAERIAEEMVGYRVPITDKMHITDSIELIRQMETTTTPRVEATQDLPNGFNATNFQAGPNIFNTAINPPLQPTTVNIPRPIVDAFENYIYSQTDGFLPRWTNVGTNPVANLVFSNPRFIEPITDFLPPTRLIDTPTLPRDVAVVPKVNNISPTEQISTWSDNNLKKPVILVENSVPNKLKNSYDAEAKSIVNNAQNGASDSELHEQINNLIDRMVADGISEYNAITYVSEKLLPPYPRNGDELAMLADANKAKTISENLVCPFQICRHNENITDLIARGRGYNNTYLGQFKYSNDTGHHMTVIITPDSPSGMIFLDSTNGRVFYDPQTAANLFTSADNSLTKAVIIGYSPTNKGPIIDEFDLIGRGVVNSGQVSTGVKYSTNPIQKIWDDAKFVLQENIIEPLSNINLFDKPSKYYALPEDNKRPLLGILIEIDPKSRNATVAKYDIQGNQLMINGEHQPSDINIKLNVGDVITSDNIEFRFDGIDDNLQPVFSMKVFDENFNSSFEKIDLIAKTKVNLDQDMISKLKTKPDEILLFRGHGSNTSPENMVAGGLRKNYFTPDELENLPASELARRVIEIEGDPHGDLKQYLSRLKELEQEFTPKQVKAWALSNSDMNISPWLSTTNDIVGASNFGSNITILKVPIDQVESIDELAGPIHLKTAGDELSEAEFGIIGGVKPEWVVGTISSNDVNVMDAILARQNPNYPLQPAQPNIFARVWDGVKKRWDESLLNWNNWGGGGSPVIDPVVQ